MAGSTQTDSDDSIEMEPQSEDTGKDGLYAFRSELDAAEGEKASEQKAPKPNYLLPVLLAVAAGCGVMLLILQMPSLGISKKNMVPYIDLGNKQMEQAGVSGRLIVRWGDGAIYQLSLDPAELKAAGKFQDMARSSLQTMSVVIRMKNAEGFAVCQKEVALSGARTQSGKTSGGDTVQLISGRDGQIGEIRAEGPFSCPLKTYQSLTAWDFSFNDAHRSTQQAQQKDEQAIQAEQPVTVNQKLPQPEAVLARDKTPRAAGARRQTRTATRLNVPMEGDDAIVAYNPEKGTVETSEGKTFLVGANGLKARSLGWQVFPASIHFRCEKNGACVLSRSNATTTLQARLAK